MFAITRRFQTLTRTLLAGGVLCAAQLMFPAIAEPYAAWAPRADLPAPLALSMRSLRKSRCLPRQEDVVHPPYPEAVVIALDWGRVPPQCALRDGWSDLGAVVMASADPPEQVVAWYQQQVTTHTAYAVNNGWLLIAAQIDDFLWDRDYYKYPNIAINPADDAWREGGYQTIIKLNRPAAAVP